MSKSLGNIAVVPDVLERVRGIELRYYMVAAHYRSVVEFSFEALDEAAKSFRRIEGFLDRAVEATGGVEPAADAARGVRRPRWTTTSGTPAAVAVIHDTVRDGNKLARRRATSALLRETLASVRGDARGARAGPAGRAVGCRAPVAVTNSPRPSTRWSRRCWSSGQAARARKDWAAADAIRDRIEAAGIDVEDTPHGPSGLWGD